MHDYSVPGRPRERQIYWLAAAAFSIMPLLTSLEGWIGVTISIATATVFGTLFFAFDRLVWRWWPVRKILGFCDLNGKWSCEGQRFDHDGSAGVEWTGQMTIVQTWSRIAITLKTDQSISRSGPAFLTREDGVGYCLLYTYANEPQPGQPELHIHRGTCELRFSENCSEASGFYFNDQNRLTFGRMKLTKQSKRTESSK